MLATGSSCETLVCQVEVISTAGRVSEVDAAGKVSEVGEGWVMTVGVRVLVSSAADTDASSGREKVAVMLKCVLLLDEDVDAPAVSESPAALSSAETLKYAAM